MKKLLILSLVGGMLLPLDAPLQAARPTAPTEVQEAKIIKRKRKARGYRKKQGFMWGLFRKNDCGCPKH